MGTQGIIFLLFVSYFVKGQQEFEGNYEGNLNGDRITLSLESVASGLDLTGVMEDSQSKYLVSGYLSNNAFEGRAEETKLGIHFDLKGIFVESALHMSMVFNYLGENHNMKVIFEKIPKVKSQFDSEKNSRATSKKRDEMLVGTWVKEELYSSGSSSNDTYGTMSISEGMIFLSDGRLAEGNSSTVIGGSNFSGSTTSEAGNIIPGLTWRTDQNIIYLLVTENGKSNEVVLGKYFVENGRMLITGTNGEKLLLTKQ